MGLNVKALGSGILGGYGKAVGKGLSEGVASVTENAIAQKAARVVGEGVTNAAIGAVGGTVTGAMVGGIAGAIDENSTVGQGMREGMGNGFLLGGLAGGVGVTAFNHQDRIMSIAKDISGRTVENTKAVKEKAENALNTWSGNAKDALNKIGNKVNMWGK